MVLFYVLAAVLALASAVALVRPLVRGGGAAAGRDAQDAALYRDQLAEIDRDVERGVMTPAEAEGARAEISRRLLSAAERADAGVRLDAAPRRYSRFLAAAAAVGAPVLALAIYYSVGAPWLPGHPDGVQRAGEVRANPAARLSQAEAEAEVLGAAEPQAPPAELEEYATLIARLETLVKERPGDVQGLELLAKGYMRLGRYGDSWRTYRQLIEAAGEQAKATYYAEMAEAMVMAAKGYVSAEAARALETALSRDPALPAARYYRALGVAQAGKVDEAIAAWEKLRAETPPDAPWRGVLDRTLAEARALRDGGAGPGAAEIAAAEAMPAEERQAMIEGMVARLEGRLTSEGGTPEEWLRLMNAYVQLDRPDDAARIARLGIESFGNSSEADFLREQALLMGLDPG